MKFEVLYALWLFLPAGVANVTPILVSRLPLLKDWNYPFDCNRSFRGKRLFGANKTWRGVIIGALMATVTFLAQQQLAPHLGEFSAYLMPSGYMDFPVILGVLLGFGALLGDAIASFFKRQRDIQPGTSWIPFDQLDYVIGSSLCAAPIVLLSFTMYVWVFILWFGAHLIFSYFGFLLGLKKTPI